jgi:hypothetical protein
VKPESFEQDTRKIGIKPDENAVPFEANEKQKSDKSDAQANCEIPFLWSYRLLSLAYHAHYQLSMAARSGEQFYDSRPMGRAGFGR